MKQRGNTGQMSRILPWILFLLLIVAITIIFVSLIRPLLSRPDRTPESIPSPSAESISPKQWGGPYCYAGIPEAQPVFHESIIVLTNTGYLVGYCEAK